MPSPDAPHNSGDNKTNHHLESDKVAPVIVKLAKTGNFTNFLKGFYLFVIFSYLFEIHFLKHIKIVRYISNKNLIVLFLAFADDGVYYKKKDESRFHEKNHSNTQHQESSKNNGGKFENENSNSIKAEPMDTESSNVSVSLSNKTTNR